MNITFENVSFKYIEKYILKDASFSITDNDKVGLIGVNGTGKTTLLKLILSIENPISGNILISGGMRINYLPQTPIFDEKKSLLDIVMEGNCKEFPIQEYEAKSILSKMGFTDTSITTAKMSGGQLKRVALAKVLVTPCDILLLDEPTNHLDNELIVWLEKYLIKWKKGLLMVTHDRYFLQRVCNKMMDLDFGKIFLYDAKYELFLELKEKRIEDEALREKRLKSFLKNERNWMTRGVEARRTKSKSRIERFNELSKTEFNEQKTMELSSISTRLGKKLISIHDGAKSFGDKELFSYFSFDLNKSDIIGIVGDNGCGKTTLFKIIMGLEELDSGELIKGETLNVGYLPQHLELIDPEIRVIDYIKNEKAQIETLDGVIPASTLLENFLFDKELQYSKVKMLSGGEKRRLQLVKVLINNPNILLFDEPTNDLDLYTLEILEDYLMKFKGPVMVVSHDRYFLDKICNKLFIFNNGYIEESNLSFSEYLDCLEPVKNEKSNSSYKNTNKMSASLRNELTKLEEDIPKLEEKIKDIKDRLALETTDYKKLMELNNEVEENEKILDQMMERFFELDAIREEYKR